MLLKKIKLPNKEYRDIIFSCDNNLFASNGLKEIIIWDLFSGQQINKFRSKFGYFSNIAFSNDGRYFLIVDSHKKFQLYDLESCKEILSFEEENIFDIAIDHLSELIAISNHKNNKIKLWDIKSNRETFIFEGYQYCKPSLSFSPIARILAIGDFYSGQVGLLDIASRKLTHLLCGIHSNGDFIFSTDGRLIAGESYYRDAVVLFNTSSGKELKVLEEKAHFHNSEITCMAISSDNKLIASGSYDLTIRLWDIATGKQIKILEGHKTTIFNLSFTNKNQNLVSGSADCTVCLWQI